MIRFPERFHASRTPGASGARLALEPNYQETEKRESDGRAVGDNIPSARLKLRFDFSALEKALGR